MDIPEEIYYADLAAIGRCQLDFPWLEMFLLIVMLLLFQKFLHPALDGFLLALGTNRRVHTNFIYQ